MFVYYYSWVPNRRIGCLDLNKRIRCENFDLSYKRIGIGNDYNKRIGRIDGSAKRVYLIHSVMYRYQISTIGVFRQFVIRFGNLIRVSVFRRTIINVSLAKHLNE